VAVIVGLAACLGGAGTASAAGLDWTGQGLSPNWSNATNWGGAAPSGTVDALDFPALTNSECTATVPVTPCYTSINDVSGLSVGAISIDDAAGYDIESSNGHAVALGSGGLDAAPSADDPATTNAFSRLGVPLTLGVPQTWSITGGPTNAQLVLLGDVLGIPTDPLTIGLATNAGLSIASADVGPATITGNGVVGAGFVKLGFFPGADSGTLDPGSLNADNGSSVTVTDGAGLLGLDGSTGPLSTAAGGLIQLGQVDHAGTLTVNGSLALDQSSALVTFISQPGTQPGADYSALNVTGSVALGGTTLFLEDGEDPGTNVCAELSKGDVDTLLSATGPLTGTFTRLVDGTPTPLVNGTTVQLSCPGSGGTPPTVMINYSANAVTATVIGVGSPGAPTTTAVTLDPANPVTDQQVTLTATVTSSGAAPVGTVEFEDEVGGNTLPVRGCEAQGVSSSGGSYTATCQTSFTTSPAHTVSAVFAPGDGSPLAGSQAPPVPVGASPAPTVTTLAISSAAVGSDEPIHLTATVASTEAGATPPTGSIDFRVNGGPIGPGPDGPGCSAIVIPTGSSGAVCDVQFSGGTGSQAETITATYSGDANFTGSTSAPQTATYLGASPSGGPPSQPAASGGAPKSTTPTAPKAGAAGIGRAGFGRASVSATMVDVIVTCAGSKGQRCTVTLALSTHEKTKAGKLVAASAAKTTAHAQVVGSRTVSLAGGIGEVVHVSLDAAGKHALASLHTLPVTLTGTERTSTGTLAPTVRRVTFTERGTRTK
jgi:hypothetical protein